MTPQQLIQRRLSPGYFPSRTIIASLVGPLRSNFPVVELNTGADIRGFWDESVVLACTNRQFERAVRVVDQMIALPVWRLILWTVDKGSLVQVVSPDAYKTEKRISTEIDVPEHAPLKNLSAQVLSEYLEYEKTTQFRNRL